MQAKLSQYQVPTYTHCSMHMATHVLDIPEDILTKPLRSFQSPPHMPQSNPDKILSHGIDYSPAGSVHHLLHLLLGHQPDQDGLSEEATIDKMSLQQR